MFLKFYFLYISGEHIFRIGCISEHVYNECVCSPMSSVIFNDKCQLTYVHRPASKNSDLALSINRLDRHASNNTPATIMSTPFCFEGHPSLFNYVCVCDRCVYRDKIIYLPFRLRVLIVIILFFLSR